MNYTADKTMTNAKIKAAAKADLTELFIEFLSEKFGSDLVGQLRIGATTPKNTLGVVIGKVNSNGEELPLTATIDITIKEFENGKTSTGKPRIAFDFAEAREKYDTYLEEKAIKSEKAKVAKENKIAQDTAKRNELNEVEDF